MSRVVWLLDLDFGGHVVRVATSACSVTTTDGRSIAYADGLQAPEVTYSVEDGPSGRDVAIQVEGQDWPALVRSGVRLTTGHGTLRRWKPGTVLEQARVHARGPILDPEWGREHEPLVLTLSSPPWGDGARVVPESYAIGARTYPVQVDATYEWDPQVEGALPAVVIGYPGDVYYPERKRFAFKSSPSDSAVAGPPVRPLSRTRQWAELAEGAPGLLAEWNRYTIPGLDSRLVFARHPVAATQVIVWDQTDKRWDLFDVQQGVDLLGQTISFVDWGSGKYVRPELGHEYWIVFLDDYGGGLRSVDGGTMTGLGEVLAWMLDQMSIPTSLGRQRGARDVLDRYKVQAVINSDVTVWDWVRSEVLPLFPVRYVEDADGGYLAPYPTQVLPEQVVDRLHPLRDGLEVVAAPKDDTSGIANHLVLRYAPGVGGMTKTAALSSETLADSATRFDPHCAQSEAIYGRRSRTWESHAIADDETAWAVLRDLARLHAMPRMDVFVETDGDRLDDRWLLDVVEVDLDEYGLPDRRGVVEHVTLQGDTVRLGIRIYEEQA